MQSKNASIKLGSTYNNNPTVQVPNETEIKQENTFVTNVFPVISNLMRNANGYKQISICTLAITTCQFILIGSWMVFDRKNYFFKNFLLGVFFLVAPIENDELNMILPIVTIVLSFICYCIIISLFIYYHIYKSAPLFLYKLSEVATHFLIYILITPLGAQAGSLIYYYFNITYTGYIIVAVFDVIVLVIGIAIIYLDSMFYGCSADLPKSIMLNFDYRMNFIVFAGLPTFGLVSFLGRFLTGPMEYLAASLFLFFCAFLIYRTINLPFPFFNTNVFQLSVFTGGFIVTAYAFNDVTKSGVFRLGIYIISIVICIIGYKLFFMFYTKKLFQKPVPESVDEIFKFVHIAMFVSENEVLLNPYIEALVDRVTEPQDRVRLARIFSFFPEYHQQLLAQTAIVRETDELNIGLRFLLFDIKRIITSRVSTSIFEELTEVKKQSHDLALAIRDTWMEISCSSKCITMSVFDGLSQKISMCNQKWDELLLNYPQNAVLAEEYSKYFIECCSNYQKATEWIYRSIQLNEGKIFDFDPAFVHFLNLFPKYVHDVLNKQKLVSIDELDARQREKLLDNRLSYAKMRIELSKNILNIRPNWINLMKCVYIFRLVVSLGICISLFFAIDIYEIPVSNIGFINNITGIGENIVLTLFPILGYGAELDGITNFYEHEKSYCQTHVNYQSPIDWSADMSNITTDSSNYGMMSLTDTVNNFLSNLDTSNVNEIVEEVNEERINISIYILDNGIISEHYPGKTNIRTATLLFYDGTRLIAGNMSQSWKESIDKILRVNINGNSIISDIQNYLNTFLKISKIEANSRNKIYLIVVMIEIILDITITISALVVFLLMKRNISMILSTFNKFKKEAIEEASQPLLGQKRNEKHKNIAPMTRQSRSSNRVAYFLVIDVFLSLLIPMMLFIVYNQFVKMNGRMVKYSTASEFMCLRKLYIIESIQNILQYSQFKHTETNFPEISTVNVLRKMLNSFEKTLIRIQDCHQALSRISFLESNISPKINEIENESPCDSINQTGVGHSYFGCLPLSTGVPWYIKKITELQTIMNDDDFLDSNNFHDSLHMALSHLYPTMARLPVTVKEIANQQSEDFNSIIVIVACIGLFASVSIFIYNIYFWYLQNDVFNTIMVLILRIPPAAAIENSQLINILLNRKDSEVTQLSISSRLVINSKYPIAILNRAFLVDAINSAFPIVLGYDLSHVAGQDISTFVTDKHFVKKLNEQYGKILSQNVICKKETGENISCNVTIIPVTDDHSNYILCHAVIVEDLSAIESKAKKAEELRKSNEEMIEAMRPELISLAVNGKIEQCAVLFIYVYEFGETKSIVLNAKRRVAMFKRFNDILARFQTVIKCQYFNNIYTVVSLPRKSSLEQERNSYVVDLVNCTLHITELFERSQVLGEFSIGIAMGGPLYVNTTSGDVHRLIVIGSPMKEAEELAGRACHGEVLITDEIYSIIAKRDLIFELKSSENEKKPVYRMKSTEKGDIDVFD